MMTGCRVLRMPISKGLPARCASRFGRPRASWAAKPERSRAGRGVARHLPVAARAWGKRQGIVAVPVLTVSASQVTEMLSGASVMRAKVEIENPVIVVPTVRSGPRGLKVVRGNLVLMAPVRRVAVATDNQVQDRVIEQMWGQLLGLQQEHLPVHPAAQSGGVKDPPAQACRVRLAPATTKVAVASRNRSALQAHLSEGALARYNRRLATESSSGFWQSHRHR